mmetsp:Transcript_5095/g.16523  ORF Transcript_5095/g.16523 Transcript_5095/m.16523 type:complete len:295 (+) Transcript_5095:777-1661(+)
MTSPRSAAGNKAVCCRWSRAFTVARASSSSLMTVCPSASKMAVRMPQSRASTSQRRSSRSWAHSASCTPKRAVRPSPSVSPARAPLSRSCASAGAEPALAARKAAVWPVELRCPAEAPRSRSRATTSGRRFCAASKSAVSPRSSARQASHRLLRRWATHSLVPSRAATKRGVCRCLSRAFTLAPWASTRRRMHWSPPGSCRDAAQCNADHPAAFVATTLAPCSTALSTSSTAPSFAAESRASRRRALACSCPTMPSRPLALASSTRSAPPRERSSGGHASQWPSRTAAVLACPA